MFLKLNPFRRLRAASPARLLIVAAIFHLAVTVIVYEIGRQEVLPGAFDVNGIAVSFASDCVGYRLEAAVLSELLARGALLEWLESSSPLHLKLYSIGFALFGWLTGQNIISAEPLNLLCYLSTLVLVFKLGRETFGVRAALLAAAVVALWPSHLLHTTQLLKDPLFEAGMLALILIALGSQSRIYAWPEALATGVIGGLIAALLWLVRADMGEIIVATALVGALMSVARQVYERRVRASNLFAMALLLAIAAGLSQVLPNQRTPDLARESLKDRARREAVLAGTIDEPVPSNVWSRMAAHVGTVRRRFVLMYPESGSNIDSDVGLSGAGDLVRYLPRATAIGLFAPFPDMWFSRGSQVGLSGRLLVGLESLLMYAFECMAIYGLWLGRGKISVWTLFSVALMGIVALGLVVANVGTLYRMRYVFLMLFVVLAAGGAAHALERFSKKMPEG